MAPYYAGGRSGASLIQERRVQQSATQSRFQSLIPCAAPVLLDPNSFNGDNLHEIQNTLD